MVNPSVDARFYCLALSCIGRGLEAVRAIRGLNVSLLIVEYQLLNDDMAYTYLYL